MGTSAPDDVSGPGLTLWDSRGAPRSTPPSMGPRHPAQLHRRHLQLSIPPTELVGRPRPLKCPYVVSHKHAAVRTMGHVCMVLSEKDDTTILIATWAAGMIYGTSA